MTDPTARHIVRFVARRLREQVAQATSCPAVSTVDLDVLAFGADLLDELAAPDAPAHGPWECTRAHVAAASPSVWLTGSRR